MSHEHVPTRCEIIIYGDARTGKTLFCKYICGNRPNLPYRSYGDSIKRFCTPGYLGTREIILCELIDHGFSVEFSIYQNQENAHFGSILLFDPNNHKTFESIRDKWINRARKERPNTKILVLENRFAGSTSENLVKRDEINKFIIENRLYWDSEEINVSYISEEVLSVELSNYFPNVLVPIIVNYWLPEFSCHRICNVATADNIRPSLDALVDEIFADSR